MRAFALLLPVFAVTGCAGMMQTATDWGVSPAVQQACMTAVAQEIPGVDVDMDFGAAMDRLQDNGLACLIAAAQDVLTAQIVQAPAPAAAGEVIAADARAAAAL